MRRLILLVLVLFVGRIYAQDVPNGQFEDWYEVHTYQLPVHYPYSSNLSATVINPAFVNVMADSNAAVGNLCLRVETAPNYSTHGWVCNARLSGPDSSWGGFPFTEEPDSFRCKLNYNVMPGDTAYLMVIFKRLGLTRTLNLFPLTGQTSGWEDFTFDLFTLPPHPAGNYDSLVIGLYTTYPFGNLHNAMQAGTYVMLDDLHFYSWTQAPNSGFENWGPGDITLEPQYWITANKQFENIIGQAYALRDSSMFGNHASICLEGISLPTGMYYTPHISLDSSHFYQTQDPAGYPISFSPDSICFDYNFVSTDAIPCMDSAHFSIHFYNGGALDKQYLVKLPCTNGTIQHIKLPISLSSQPDLFNIYFSPLEMDFSNKENYRLCIDNVSFFCGGIGMQELDELDSYIFPNPASRFAQLPEWADFYMMYDASGRMVLNGSETQIDISELSDGVYSLRVQNKEGWSSSFRLVVRHE